MLAIMCRLVSYSWLIFVLILLFAVSRRSALPELENGFDLCPTPCWAGIIPGQTLLEDVPHLVASHFHDDILLSRYNRFTAFLIDAPELNILGEIGSQQGYVHTISLNTLQPFWQMLLLLGSPHCIQEISDTLLPGVINIFWKWDDVYVMSSLNPVATNKELLTNTLQIRVISPGDPCSIGDNIHPWPALPLSVLRVEK